MPKWTKSDYKKEVDLKPVTFLVFVVAGRCVEDLFTQIDNHSSKAPPHSLRWTTHDRHLGLSQSDQQQQLQQSTSAQHHHNFSTSNYSVLYDQSSLNLPLHTTSNIDHYAHQAALTPANCYSSHLNYSSLSPSIAPNIYSDSFVSSPLCSSFLRPFAQIAPSLASSTLVTTTSMPVSQV
ncbi:unnamed protein product, partial [Protopolystoma xenopodis]